MPTRKWAKTIFSKAFPRIVVQEVLPPPVGALQQGPDLVALITSISAAHQSTGKSSDTTIPPQKQDDSKQTSKSEMAALLRMCGKSITGALTNLPAWLQECADKCNTYHYRQMIVQKYIMENSYFEDADVPMTAQLLNMIMKRA